MTRKPNLNHLDRFVATVEAGTITGAAEALGISKAAISKQIQLLEEDIGVPLLLRNTRHLQPTKAGYQFYQNAKSALLQAYSAYERIQDKDNIPKGRLRITAPVDFGVTYVAPFIAKFQDSYPQVTIDTHLSDDMVDLIEGRFDLAFRIGALRDSNFLARKLFDFEVIAVCSKETAKRHAPQNPEDLEMIPYIQSMAMAAKTEWVFKHDGQARSVRPKVVASTNNTLAMVAQVMNGNSYTILPDFLLKDQLRDKSLTQLFPNWSLAKDGVFIVTQPNSVRTTALKKFIELAHRQIIRP